MYVLPSGSGGPGRGLTQKKKNSEIAIQSAPASAMHILKANLIDGKKLRALESWLDARTRARVTWRDTFRRSPFLSALAPTPCSRSTA